MPVSVEISGQRRIRRRLTEEEKRINKEVKGALVGIALTEIESKAKQTLTSEGHVDTGRLRASINTKWFAVRANRYSDDFGNVYNGTLQESVAKDEVIVGTNVEYAKYIERKFPFLRPAFQAAKPRIAAEIAKEVKV